MSNRDQYHPGTIERYGSTHVIDRLEGHHYCCVQVTHNQSIPGDDYLVVHVTPRCNGDVECTKDSQRHRPVLAATLADVDRNGFKVHLLNVSSEEAKHVHIYWSVIRGGGQVEVK